MLSPANVCCWGIVLKKSPTGRCGEEIGNKGIEASRFLNHCCVSGLDLESIFRAQRRKLVFQHNRGTADSAVREPTARGSNCLQRTARKPPRIKCGAGFRRNMRYSVASVPRITVACDDSTPPLPCASATSQSFTCREPHSPRN